MIFYLVYLRTLVEPSGGTEVNHLNCLIPYCYLCFGREQSWLPYPYLHPCHSMPAESSGHQFEALFKSRDSLFRALLSFYPKLPFGSTPPYLLPARPTRNYIVPSMRKQHDAEQLISRTLHNTADNKTQNKTSQRLWHPRKLSLSQVGGCQLISTCLS